MRDPPDRRLTRDDPEPQGPYPLRWWWLKRLAVGTAALALSLSLVRVGWGWEAERRLRRVLGEVAARGEPVRPGDVAPPDVPDAENAAIVLLKAAAAVDPDADCPSSSGVAFGGYPPFPPLWVQMADASVAASPKAFELTRQARALGRARWAAPVLAAPGPRIFASPTQPLLGIHHLANTVSDAALDMHMHGDDVAALEAIRDTRHLARSVGAYPGLAGSMIARNHDSIATYKVHIIATGLTIGPDHGPTGADPGNVPTLAAPNPPARPATRSQVRELIAEFLDERYFDADLRPGLAADQAMRVEAGEWAARSTRLLRPMVLLDLARLLESGRPSFEAAKEPTWPAARAVLAAAGQLTTPPANVNYYPSLPPPAGTRRQPVDFAHLLTRSDLVLKIDRVIEINMRTRFERRAAAVSLAAQLYRADHGDWPPHLAALVPAYLPAVPVDPFSPDAGPLRYLLVKGGLPDGRDRPVVYTVNLDGRDDTPDGSQLSSSPAFGWKRARDVHVDLAAWPSPPTSTTAPSAATRPAKP